MLVEFSVENWKSFKNRATLSMIASKERAHKEHITKIDFSSKESLKLLPVAMVFGGNASGKSNLFKALQFMQEYIINGTGEVTPFKLGVSKNPTTFCIKVLIDRNVWSYSFSINDDKVESEKLQIYSRRKDIVYYSRSGQSINLSNDFIDAEKRLHPEINEKALEGLKHFIPENRLFLSNAQIFNLHCLTPLWKWFLENLCILYPESKLISLPAHVQDDSFFSLLSEMDTGIDHFEFEPIPKERIPIPKTSLDQMIRNTPKVNGIRKAYFFVETTDRKKEYFILEEDGSQSKFRKLVCVHKSGDGGCISFDMSEESDGTQRMIDVIPAFTGLTSSKGANVLFIDEFDCRLHPILTHRLIEYFLENRAPEATTQIILTTHDTLLIDQDMIRRDELWFTDRAKNGESTLYSCADFSLKKLRSDFDLRKFYLGGAMGGVPRPLL